MNYKCCYFLFFFLIITNLIHAQSVNIPLNSDYYHLIDRYEIKSGSLSKNFHSSFKGYQREEIARFADSINTSSSADKFNQAYLKNDSWEFVENYDIQSKKPFWKHFYKYPSDLLAVRTKDFDLHVNPVLGLSIGNDTEGNARPFVNTRGVQVRGMIDNKVGFYSYIGENQVIYPQYVRNYITTNLVVPGEGFWKKFKTNGVDYFTVRGYISFNATKHINLQFGRDQFRIGNGHRSLILSDFAPAYTFFKIKTKIWKFQYTNLYTQMTASINGNIGGTFGSGGFSNKNMALHHLSLNIGKKVNIGIFESIIIDSGQNSKSDYNLIKYLNPIIFYRALEQQGGSPDNALLGLDFKWLVMPKISVYGQLVLDEFLLENLRAGKGWWGNKYGIQFGGKYVDAFGLDNLDLQLESNIVRPYTYTHIGLQTNYAHYLQPLAHPLGANFKEIVAIARYQPIPRLSIAGKVIRASYGTDPTRAMNWGGDINKSNLSREKNFGNTIGQGVSTKLTFLALNASYQFKHNLFLDLKHILRKVDSENNSLNQSTNYTSLSLRWNLPRRLNEF